MSDSQGSKTSHPYALSALLVSALTLWVGYASVDAERRSRSPILSVPQCCNQVPINISGSRHPIELRRLEKVIAPGDDEYKARAESPYVVHIENVGGGPALETKAYWKVSRVVLSDGRTYTLDDAEVNGPSRPHAWPHTIKSGEMARVLHLPDFVTQDARKNVLHVDGSLLIRCKDSRGVSHEFSQKFTMDTVYTVDLDDELGPRLSFHFAEAPTVKEGGPSSHFPTPTGGNAVDGSALNLRTEPFDGSSLPN